MKIVVLCGGTSSERTVSLKTSEKVAKALASREHQVALVDIYFGCEDGAGFCTGTYEENIRIIEETAASYHKKTALLENRVYRPVFFGANVLKLCTEADIVFLGLHGANGEDGRVQATFDLLGIKYTGSGHLGSAIAMSKYHTKKVLSSEIPMPKGIILRKSDPEIENFPTPCVVKPSNGGSSLGVYIVTEDKDYLPAVKEAFEYDDVLLVEEFISGRELTQGVLNGKALPPVEIIPDEGFYDYTNKYNGLTKEVCPAEISPEVLEEMSRYSVLAGKILGLSVYYRMDYLLDASGKLFCLEANTLPGMTDTSLVPQEAAAIGMNYSTLCEKIIQLSLKK
ncbi:MAG: D-alanine--D-alanine ligase [Parasporobacterium sp.]|nr:D-alanine--D-alanine ligase [Parasporobacterium sp.]